jgi:hypothetical protein
VVPIVEVAGHPHAVTGCVAGEPRRVFEESTKRAFSENRADDDEVFDLITVAGFSKQRRVAVGIARRSIPGACDDHGAEADELSDQHG